MTVPSMKLRPNMFQGQIVFVLFVGCSGEWLQLGNHSITDVRGYGSQLEQIEGKKKPWWKTLGYSGDSEECMGAWSTKIGYLDLVCTAVYAFDISTDTGFSQELDLFGILASGWAISGGGGTVRDVIFGWPGGPFWMDYVYYTYIGTVFSVLGFFSWPRLQAMGAMEWPWWKTLKWAMDYVGLCTGVIYGANKAENNNAKMHVVVLSAFLASGFGGVWRDILSGRSIGMFHGRNAIWLSVLIGGFVHGMLRQRGDIGAEARTFWTSLVLVVTQGLFEFFDVRTPAGHQEVDGTFAIDW